MKTALTIAGSDSSGGAGIQADIKTMTANGVFAMSAITALTAQNTTGVTDIFETTPHFLAEQLDAVFTDIYPDAVKIGMVSSAELIGTIADKLQEYGAKHIVVDPVMVATSGSKLLRDDAVDALTARLLPMAEVLTPNIPEAEILSGMSIKNAADMEKAWAENKTAAFLTIENGSALAGDITRVHTLAEQGVRAITLTWNGENELGSGHTTDHGLSEFGKEAVREMEKEGILVDVSHLNDHGFADLLEVAAKPFVATHSNARALCSHKRNLTDDMIREMVRRDCLIGLNYFVKFLRDDGEVHSLDDIYRHTMHFFELGGKKNLALGSDFDGSLLPECLNTPAKAASIYEYLISRGVSQEDADGVMYKNAQEFFRKNLR